MHQMIQAFKLAIPYINRYPKFWLYFFMRLLTTIAEVLVPVLVGYIIVLFTNKAPSADIYRWTGVLVAILIFSPMLDKISFVNAWYISFRAAHDFRRDAVRRLRHTGLAFWQENDRGNVLKIIDQAFEHFIYLCGSIVHSYVPFIGKIIVIFISTTFIDPVISIIFLIDAVFFSLNIRIIVPKESEAGIRERKAQESVYGRMNEYITNYKTVLYLNLFHRQDEEISRYNEAAYTAYTQRERLSGLKWYFNNQTHAICVAAIIAYSVWQVLTGNLQVGMLTTIVFFSLRIAENMTEFVWQLSELVKYSNSLQRYTDTFATVQEHYSDAVSKKIDFEKLVLQQVSLQQKDRETLRNVNMEIKNGEKVAIVGFTGSGKTTLIDILLQANTSYTGDIFIDEYNYHDVHVQDIAKVYSIVPQDVQLFQGTLRDNIAIDSGITDTQLHAVVTVSCLDPLVEKLPHRLQSHIHEGASNISGGERQRIGVARALLQRHPVLILDEATASLDPKTERDLITNIIAAYPKMTILYITHKYSLLNLFDKIIVMNEGSIIEQGSFEHLVEKGGLFKDLYEASQMQ